MDIKSLRIYDLKDSLNSEEKQSRLHPRRGCGLPIGAARPTLALKRALMPIKVHRLFKFGQNAWVKSYIDLNTRLNTRNQRA